MASYSLQISPEPHDCCRRYNTVRITLLSIAGVGLYLYLRKDQFKKDLTDGVADVASRSLGDENVVIKVEFLV
jgi:hypothetical protein